MRADWGGPPDPLGRLAGSHAPLRALRRRASRRGGQPQHLCAVHAARRAGAHGATRRCVCGGVCCGVLEPSTGVGGEQVEGARGVLNYPQVCGEVGGSRWGSGVAGGPCFLGFGCRVNDGFVIRAPPPCPSMQAPAHTRTCTSHARYLLGLLHLHRSHAVALTRGRGTLAQGSLCLC